MKKLMLGLSSGVAVTVYGLAAMAQNAAPAAGGEMGTNQFDVSSWAAIAAAIAIGVAAFGGALGQGRVGAAALEGIARNPNAANKIQTPMILGLALIETLVLYALVIAILLYLKVH
jgi:F-type H+-transporting ATPase subunit c